jgi:deoxyribodipyrimidine photo-lyase
MKPTVNIMWFRRDLRLRDNAALYHALKSNHPIVPIFIFDRNILDQLDNKADRRVAFIHAALQEMQDQLLPMNSSLQVYYDFPENIYQSLLKEYSIEKVFVNHDYEPYALKRENKIAALLQAHGTSLHTFKDQVIFEKEEVLKDDGKPYTVFTPYANKWRSRLKPFHVKVYPTEKYFSNFYKQQPVSILSLKSMGFEKVDQPFPSRQLADDVISHYAERRNFPALENGTSKMGVHLRFGTVSIRELAGRALQLNNTYLNELIWRDFYHMILWHFQKVGKGQSFKAAYDLIEWRNNENEFQKWCDGMTGYPIVDAGMRELNATGYMHNRVRMITASFLVKHLLIDWHWGEAYFAEKLMDFDLAANNGGWQWASGSGCDSAPYFRVFNPTLQTEKFDKDLKYIKKWVPEFQEFSYPKPMVVHEVARKRVLEVYAKALKK